jgi:hypothetical protein
MYAGGALSVVYGVAEGISTDSATVSSAPHPAAYNAGYDAAGTIMGLVQCGLWLWMAAKNKAGRGWARILSTVFFGIWCLGLIVNLAVVALGSARFASVVVAIAVVALGIVGLSALILLWQRESSDYFAATSQAKQMAAAYRAYSATSQFSQFSQGQSGHGPPPQ